MTRHGDVAFVFERGPNDRNPCHLDNNSKQACRVCVVVATSETTVGLPYASIVLFFGAVIATVIVRSRYAWLSFGKVPVSAAKTAEV